MNKAPIGAFATGTHTGWAAYNKEGHSWPVPPDEAAELEEGRKSRNSNANKPHTP